MSKVSKAMVERLTEELHGSGINYDWDIEETKTSFRASNAYDPMGESGMYDSPADFTVIFPKGKDMQDFKLQFNGKVAQRMNTKHALRDYLEETIAFTIEELGPDIFYSKTGSARKEEGRKLYKALNE